MIERKIKTNILKDLHYFPAVAILGPRQVGKTTLAKELIGRGALYLDSLCL
jgi:predicted AAA+ superfamily ATPase